MAHRKNDNKLDAVMELLIENGFEALADVLRILFNEAMKIERNQALGAQLYQRTDTRRGYANGYKPKTVDTRIGRLSVDVPQVRGEVGFYPSSLERGCRSERALKLAIAEMYVKGISTRRVTDVLEKMCGLDISSTQVSRVARILDEQLNRWRDRLRVLLPNDPNNYYHQRDLLPPHMMEQLGRVKILITNFHAFLLREKIAAGKLTKSILNRTNKDTFQETPDQMVRRVCRELGNKKNIIVISIKPITAIAISSMVRNSS